MDDNEFTLPPISDKQVSDTQTYFNNYYAISREGEYEIKNLTAGPSDVIIKHQATNEAARVKLKTGQIEILDPEFEMKAIPATENLPTRISILKKNFDTVLSNIYYVADAETNVQILEESLTQSNIRTIGVTIGDANSGDFVIAKNIPAHVADAAGAAVIFNDETRQNIAMISTSGSIRLMKKDYSLRIKNEGRLNEFPIFQIVDPKGRPIFDVFIGADFENLEIRQNEQWNEIGTLIGYLQKGIHPIFASLVAQNKPRLPKPAAPKIPSAYPPSSPKIPSAYPPSSPAIPSTDQPVDSTTDQPSATDQPVTPISPFPDLDPSHPQYEAIIDLYERRIVSGYADGSFRPNAKLTRAEFVKIALGATGCFDCSQPDEETKAQYGPQPPFPDVRLPAWYNYCVAIAKDIGMVTGYGDGLFKPGNNISRAEAAAVLIRQSEIELQDAPENYFADVSDDAWYKDYVYTAVQIGLIPESFGFVAPDEQITRGEFAFMASGVLDLQDCKPIEPEDECRILINYDPSSDPENIGKKCCPCIDNLNQNDTDRDGIIDACDPDIDADSVTNTLCFFDDDGLIQTLEAERSEDNCIFIPNPDQADADTDGTGDVCLPVDQCPELPEDLDGVEDLDGCPEVEDLVPANPPGVFVNKGPLCQLLDYEADLTEDDIIMTAITDVDTHEVIYEQSNEVTYPPPK